MPLVIHLLLYTGPQTALCLPTRIPQLPLSFSHFSVFSGTPISWWTNPSTSPVCLPFLALTETWLSSWIEGCLLSQASHTSGLEGRIGHFPAPQYYCQTITLKINRRLSQLACPRPIHACIIWHLAATPTTIKKKALRSLSSFPKVKFLYYSFKTTFIILSP